MSYFSSVVGRKFKRDDPEFSNIGDELVNRGVHAKTAYWASLMRAYGLHTEFRNDWQINRLIRYYTWARVFPSAKSPKVFYTIGVGSRFTEDKLTVSLLVYKLDCRRDGFSELGEKLFDDHMAQHAPEATYVSIESVEFPSLNWKLLAERTRDFLDRYEKDFWEVRNIVGGNINDDKKIARVCWNTNGWAFPSSSEGKSVSAANPHEKERGYGFEEWLFNTTKQIDGYRYSFLQAFNKGEHHGRTYDIKLYAFDHSAVGRINTGLDIFIMLKS